MMASRYGRSWFMVALPYNYRETLRVLADYGDYGRAAEALGICRWGFICRVSDARQAFRVTLWRLRNAA